MSKRKIIAYKARRLAKELREERLRSNPNLAPIFKELDALEAREAELRLEMRKKHFDSLSPEEKRIRTLIGWNPYKNDGTRITYRDGGKFIKKK